MTSVCSTTPLRTCEAAGDRLNRSISSASASWSLSHSHYRWNPYDKVCPKAPITPTAESAPSTTASPIHFHLDLVPTIAFPLPVDLSPRTDCGEYPLHLHLTKVFRVYPEPSLQDSDDAETDDSTTDAPVKVVEYRSYGIKVTKSTAAYREYLRQVPAACRKPSDPSTPRPAVRCSRKQWGMQMKQWRQALENYRY